MATRSVLRGVVQDTAGNKQGLRQVKVCQYGTTTPVAFTLYADRTSLVPITATLTTDSATGCFEAWCDGPGGPPVTVLDLTTGASEVANFVPDSPVTETDAQTLTNKTLTSPTWTGTVTATGATINNGTFAGPTLSAPTVSGAGTLANGGSLSSGANTFDIKARLTDSGQRHFDVKHPKFGAVGNGGYGGAGADDTAAIQAAITACAALGGGTVYFPPGGYRITSTLSVTRGVNLVGHWSDHDADGSGSTAPASWLVWGGVDHGTMIQFMSEVAGNVVTGGGLDGLVLDGFNTAAAVCDYLVRFRGVQRARIGRLGVRNFRLGGVWLDDQAGAITTSNLIDFLDCTPGFAYNTASGCGDAGSGLILHGSSMDPAASGVTKNLINTVRGSFYNGNLVQMRFCDNNYIHKIHAIGPQVGSDGGATLGTGKALRLVTSDAAPDVPPGSHPTHGFPAGNVVDNVNGNVHVEDYTHGNWLGRHQSEGSRITINDVTKAHLGYVAFDYVTLQQFEAGAPYPMLDEQSFGPPFANAQGTPGNSGIGNLWSSAVLADAADTAIGGARTPYAWSTGTITKIRVRYSNDVANNNFVVRLRASTLQYGIVGSSPTPPAFAAEYDSGATAIPADSSTARGAIADFAPNLGFVLGDTLDWSLQRVGTSGSDTNTGSLFIREVTFYLASSGPPNTGVDAKGGAIGAYTPSPPRSSPF